MNTLGTREFELKRLKSIIRNIANKFFVNFTGLSYTATKTLEDLIQEGNIGALEAYNKFNPEKNTKFQSFAYFHIRNRIQLFTAANMGACRQIHTKMTNDFNPVLLDNDVNVTHLDANIEKFEITNDLEIRFSILTELEKDALGMKFGLKQKASYPEALPLQNILADCGIRKLRRFKR